MSGTGKRKHSHKKGGRHPPSSLMLENPQVHYDPQFVQQQPNAALQYPHDVAYSHRRLEANASGSHYDVSNPADTRPYINSQSNTAYNSPDQSQIQIGQYAAPEFQGPYHNAYNLGGGAPYDEYGNLMYADADYHNYPGIQQTQYEQHLGSAYYNHPGLMQPNYPAPVGYYTDSPPTPAASDQTGDRKRVKGSNRPIAPHKSAETPRITPDITSHPAKGSRRKSSENPAKPAKHTKNKKGKADIPILTAPLSELTKSYNIPLKNMDEWVNRSVEIRLKECSKKKEGWIPRPMNSFMLYRSAYAERTKHWCLQNNHQVVSSVSGLSWPMEPPEIRDRFIEYARQERENHAKAHPGYKFSPAKTDASRRKRKGETTEQDDDESVDLEELDYDWQPSRSNTNVKRKRRAKKTKTGYDSEDPANYEFHLEEYETHSVHNPGISRLPEHDGLEHQEVMADADFFEPDTEQAANFLEAQAPHSNVEPQGELVGLPGADHHELLVDPQLNGDNINLDGIPEVAMPLDPDFDPAIQGGYDFEQLNELYSSIGETFLKTFNEPGIFDSLESKPIDPSGGGNQHSHHNETDNGHQKSVQNQDLDDYGHTIQDDLWDVHHYEFPPGFEDENPYQFSNIPQQESSPGDHGPKTQKIPEKVDQGEANVEKSADEKPNDERPGDGTPSEAKSSDPKPGDAKPDGAEPGDEKPNDDEPGDEAPGDEQPGDEELFEGDLFEDDLFEDDLFEDDLFNGDLFDEEAGDEKPGDKNPSDGKPIDEKSGNGAPSVENPDNEILSREKLDHPSGGIEKPSSTKKRSR